MKIGDLFIALGFKIEGQSSFDSAERGLSRATISAGKLALGINAVNAALIAMMATAARAAQTLHNFATTTGLSTTELQRWQQAAEAAGSDAATATSAVLALQDARNAFALGEPNNVGAWSLLGVDPRKNPFEVLDSLRKRIQTFRDPAIARALLGKVGLEAALPVLQLPDAEFARFRESISLGTPQIEGLVRFNREWQRLRINLTAAKNEFAAALAPALAMVARGVAWLSGRLAILSDWLVRGGTAAKLARAVVGFLAAALLGLGAALAIVVGFLGALAAAVALVSVAASPVLGALAALSAIVLAVAGGIAALILLLDDFWTAAEGGKSAFNWGASIKVVDLLAAGIERAAAAWDRLAAGLRAGSGLFERAFSKFASDDLTLRLQAEANRGSAWLVPPGARGSSAVTQNNNVDVRVDGARSPEATGRAVATSLRREIAGAAYQGAVPGY